VNDVEFFKFYEMGYDKQRAKWANEIIIEAGYKNTFQLPSDIKPGMYILRTDLLSLHGNGMIDGPQFYTHCFNLDISGTGNAAPSGVKFPGGYKENEPGVVFRLSGNPDAYANYVSRAFLNVCMSTDGIKKLIPGPPLYKAKFDPPTGERPAVTGKDIGLFPPEFQAKYDALQKKYNTYTSAAAAFFDYPSSGGVVGRGKGKGSGAAWSNPFKFFSEHSAQEKELAKERDQLRAEAIKLGLVDQGAPTNAASQVF
jgi:hypothetical protein